MLFSDVILRPGFIYGNRRVGNLELPLGVIGSPLEMVSFAYFCNLLIATQYVPL